MRGTSRLWRKLNPDHEHSSLFQLRVGNRTLTDDQLLSVTVTRGDNSPHPGLSPSVIEWQTATTTWASKLDTNVYFSLSNSFATSLGSTDLAPRASGRLGSWTTDDHGQRRVSTVQAVHWSALIRNTKRSITTQLHQGVMFAAAAALEHPALPYAASVGGPAGADQDLIWVPQENVRRSDVLDKMLDATGAHARELRSGKVAATALDQTENRTRQQRATVLPILRRHGIAPATWAQPVGHLPKLFMIDRIRWDGQRVQEVGPTWEAVDTDLADVEHIDWSHIRTQTMCHQIYLRALASQANYPDNRLDTVELDMITLLASPAVYDRRIARQVLGMEVGDVVLISGDWPAGVRGVYLANKITEKITPDSWRIELSLQSARDVLGWNWEEYLDTPAYTWDQMNARSGNWDSSLKPWEHYALPA